jgi:hypothetical protein
MLAQGSGQHKAKCLLDRGVSCQTIQGERLMTAGDSATPLTEPQPRDPSRFRMPDLRGTAAPRHRGAACGDNVETLHPVETSHVWCVFYFRRTKSFHVNGRPGPNSTTATRRAALKGTAPPLSQRHWVITLLSYAGKVPANRIPGGLIGICRICADLPLLS